MCRKIRSLESDGYSGHTSVVRLLLVEEEIQILSDKNARFDLIGDIHGCDQTLQSLLQRLDYIKREGIYQHPNRTVIFLGDFIDRGPHQREVLATVRPMIDSGKALAVMGNHEFNAIAYAAPDPEGEGYLRKHTQKNRGQHQCFLAAYEDSRSDYDDVIAWFKTLPMWLDLGSIRIVHACWDHGAIKRIGGALITEELIINSARPGTTQFKDVETILKGKEVPLPERASFFDKDGNERHDIRIRWWDQKAGSYKEAFLGPESARTHIPDDPIQGDHLVEYPQEGPPVFLGHYWLGGNPEPLAPNIACLDYSVAKSGGKLVAYRWDGEQELSAEKFVSVERVESS